MLSFICTVFVCDLQLFLRLLCEDKGWKRGDMTGLVCFEIEIVKLINDGIFPIAYNVLFSLHC